MQAVSQCQEHASAGGVNITSKCKVTVANQKPEKKKKKPKGHTPVNGSTSTTTQGKGESYVRTVNEAELLLNIKLEYEFNKMQENAV